MRMKKGIACVNSELHSVPIKLQSHGSQRLINFTAKVKICW